MKKFENRLFESPFIYYFSCATYDQYMYLYLHNLVFINAMNVHRSVKLIIKTRAIMIIENRDLRAEINWSTWWRKSRRKSVRTYKICSRNVEIRARGKKRIRDWRKRSHVIWWDLVVLGLRVP